MTAAYRLVAEYGGFLYDADDYNDGVRIVATPIEAAEASRSARKVR